MAKNDFILKIGFKIDSRSISKKALRDALNKAANGLVLNISKVKLKNPQSIRRDISKQLGSVAIDNLTVSSRAAKSFARSINDRVKPTIKGLSVSSGSLNNLRKSVERALKNVQVTVANLPSGGAGGGRQAPGGGSSAVARGNQRVSQSARDRAAAMLEMARAEREALVGMDRIQRSSLRVNTILRQSGFTLEEFGGKVGQVTKRFAEYAVSVAAVRAAQQTIRLGIEGVRELDDAIQDLAKVGSVGEDIDKGFQALADTALQTGRSIGDASDAIGEFVRQGKQLETAAKFAANALKLSNISALNGADAARLVTAAQQVWGSTAEELGSQLSSLAVFADSSATNVTEIGQAVLRSASSAQAAGLTIEQSFALLAATLEQTRLNASTVGTAFKTILARLGRDKDKVADLSNGFLNLTEGQEGFIASGQSVSGVIDALAKNFRKLNADQKNAVALQVAGVRQANVFIGLLNNYKKAQDLLNNSQQDSSALNEKNQRQLDKLSTRFVQLQTSVKVAAGALAGLTGGQQGGIAAFTKDVATNLTSAFTAVTSVVTGLNSINDSFNFGTTLATGLVGAFAGLARATLPVVVSSAKAFLLGMQQTQAAVQGINAALAGTVQQTGQAADNMENAAQASRGLGTRREPTRRSLISNAALSAGAFAFGDIFRQSAENFKDEVDKIEAEAERLGISVDNSAVQFNQFASNASSTIGSTLQSVGLFGVKIGFAVAGLQALGQILTSLQDFDDASTQAAIRGVTDNVKSFGRGTVVDLQASVNQTSESISKLGESLDRDLKLQDTATKFKAAIDDATGAIAANLERAKLELAGLPDEAVGILSDLSSVREKLRGAVFTGETTGGQKVAGARDVSKALSANALANFDITTDETKRLEETTARYKKRLSDLNSEVLKASFPLDKFIEGLQLTTSALQGSPETTGDFLKDALTQATKSADEIRTKANNIYQKELEKQNITAEEIAAAEEKRSAAFNTATQGFSTIIGAIAKLKGIDVKITEFDFATALTTGNFGRLLEDFAQGDKQLAKGEFIKALATASNELTKEREQILTASEGQAASLRDKIKDAEKQSEKAKEKAVSLSKEQLNLETQLIQTIAKAIEFSDVDLDKSRELNSETGRRIALEKELATLKSGTIQQQIRALRLEALSKVEQDKTLEAIRERIKLVEQQGTAQEQAEVLPGLRRQEAEARRLAVQRLSLEIQPEIDKLFKEETLKRVEEANKRLEEAYDGQADALKDLQDARQKVFEAEKNVANAGKEVASVMLSIAAAQANLSRVVESSFANIRNAARSALSSAGFEVFGSISSSLDLIVSQEQRLNVIRKEGLEESLRISQEQARTLLSIGERVATGGPGARLEAIRGIQTAQAIQGGAAISSFTPEDIKAALAVENLFPGLKEAVQTQALATLGLDDELAALKTNIKGIAAGQAEQAAKEQLRVASAQLSTLLSQLTSAENQERIANDDLALAREAANADRQKLDAARLQVAYAQQNLEEVKFSNRNLEKIGNIFARGGSTPIPNAARGTLTSAELSGLQAAAMREKALMPAGSKLMLANTSETVLTRKQAGSLGLRARNQSNAVNGNGDFTGLVEIMAGLISEIRGLRADVQSGGVSNVNLQVDTNKNINVKGINGLGQRLEAELRGKFASGNDVSAVNAAILDILTKLGESGLTDDLGR